jgi:hypothetical protein
MLEFELNILISEYNYSELFLTDRQLDDELKLKHLLRSKAKNNRDILLYDKCNDEIDTMLINKETVKRALMVKERNSVEIFRNRLIGVHYLN